MPGFADRGIAPPRPLRLAAAGCIGGAIALIVVLVFGAIAAAATSGTGGNVDLLYLLATTTLQASLTTILSLAVGFALAWALNRLRFPGRDLLVGFFASALVTPGIVLAFGLLAVWGRSGWINEVSEALGWGRIAPPIFGLGGILFAHVILDGAFAARILLARLDSIPLLRLKTARSLGLAPWQRLAILDWPAIRSSLPGLGSIIFLLAFTSFPIVLLLGGGPANQTLEVAIYSAVRLDFDLLAAIRIALVQILACGAVILVASAFAPIPALPGRGVPQSWPAQGLSRAIAALLLIAGTLAFALPLVSVLASGAGPGLGALAGRQSFWWALGASLGIGIASALLTLLLALGLTLGRAAARSSAVRLAFALPAYAYLAVPAVVLSLGFFILVRNLGLAPDRAAPAVVILANALLALPFAVATLGPALDAIARGRGRLIRSLGLSGWRQFRYVEWPLIGRDIGLVLAIAFCFSFGDLGVIALFGTQDFATLPLLMLRALGGYRNDDAASIAAILLLGSFLAFTLFPKLVARISDAAA